MSLHSSIIGAKVYYAFKSDIAKDRVDVYPGIVERVLATYLDGQNVMLESLTRGDSTHDAVELRHSARKASKRGLKVVGDWCSRSELCGHEMSTSSDPTMPEPADIPSTECGIHVSLEARISAIERSLPDLPVLAQKLALLERMHEELASQSNGIARRLHDWESGEHDGPDSASPSGPGSDGR
jgi:hypothetical protein